MASVTINQPNSFPFPVGPGVTFVETNQSHMGMRWHLIKGLYTTRNFTLQMRGLWTVVINFSDFPAPTDQVVLNVVSGGTNGSFDGTNTVVLTAARSGYFSLMVPQGFAMYNFTTVNPIKSCGMIACDLATWNG